jgi:nesprin-1
MNEETATIISRKLEEHKAFFVNLPAVQSKFENALHSPTAHNVPAAQLDNIAARLSAVGPLAAERRVKLKFLEHKVYIMIFFNCEDIIFTNEAGLTK